MSYLPKVTHMTNPLRFRGLICSIAVALAMQQSAFAEAPKDRGEYVSIIRLVANPERYHGKVVFLSAYATVKFEGNQLCAVQKPASTKDCLWLQFDDGPYVNDEDLARYKRAKAKWEKFNGKLISLRGTFSMENTGHFGLWSGAIEYITDVTSR